jgi:GAF domain-containing protein
MADQIGSFHTLPINAGDTCVGCLLLTSRTRIGSGRNAIRLGRELAAQAAHAIDRASSSGSSQARAETDGLTGLLNHRAAFEALDRRSRWRRRSPGRSRSSWSTWTTSSSSTIHTVTWSATVC